MNLLNIISYIKHIISMYEKSIDSSFMEELLGYVEQDDFVYLILY